MNEVFSMVPAPARALWMLGTISALLLGLFGLFAYIGYWSRHTQFEISATALDVSGPYGRRVPLTSIVRDGVRTVDFGREPNLRPRIRTGGIGLPGYSVGWFRLRDGSRALLYVTDRRRTVLIPTRDGHAILLSPTDPDGFAAALRGRS